jgi:ParB-like chromosome segregation protein Spo0J
MEQQQQQQQKRQQKEKEKSNEYLEIINIEDIDIDAESRFRKDIAGDNNNDLDLLCNSIKEIGLLHPIVITNDRKLIAGHRRIEACKKLGWSKIPARIVDFFNEGELNRRKGEFHENTVRKDFTASERVAIKRFFEPIEKEKAEERMKAGKEQPSPKFGRGRASDNIASYTGVSDETLKKEEKIVQAAEKNPIEYKPILEQVDSKKLSSDRAFKEIQQKEKLKQTQQKINQGESLTDEDIMTSLNISIRPYSVWNFSGLDNRFGVRYPGQIPADIVFNTLYFFTKPNDLVVDFMAGGGVTGDVCKVMKRRCLMYDINPVKQRMNKILQYDITDINKEIPEEVKQAELFFFDPPYYKKKAEEYGNKSISALSRDEYLDSFKIIADKIYNQTSIQKIALLVSDYDDEYAGHPEENIFVWDYINTILESDGYKHQHWRVHRHIHCPLSTQQLDPQQITRYVKGRKLYGLSRSLVIFYRV